MGERRSLTEGMKATPGIDPAVAKEFIHGEKPSQEVRQTTPQDPAMPTIGRSPISTRIRADFAAALKRASLERQLQNMEPNTLQAILEEAIEPWLRRNGYFP